MPFEKLVRDKIPALIRMNGETPSVRVASPAEIDSLLREKLVEEAEEFRASGSVEELADVLEVIHAILSRRGIDYEEIDTIRREKRRDRGGFEQQYVLLMDK